jgi:Na+/H+ antiporter NhaD/arsenite permease-like protein
VTAAYVVSVSIFLATFVVFLTEKAHRTIVALAGAAVMLLVGMAMGFYSQEQAFHSIDFNTLGLLLGMMILVAMLGRTGAFEYLATVAAKWSGGNPWYLLLLLAGTTTVLSLFLNNVTTIVLIGPVTILVAEILGISPIPLLMAEALLSDTGGVATLIGDPPNVLIGSAAGFSFNDFLVHLAPVVLVACLAILVWLRIAFRKELSETPENIEALMTLDAEGALRDKKSLTRVVIVLGVVILLFFTADRLHLTPALVALLGAIGALVWVRPDVEATLRDVEWSVLLFFAALFVTVGGVEASGVLGLVAEPIANLAEQNLLLTAIALLWISAMMSAIVDNIPFTIIMIPVILELQASGIYTAPLWWALALGAGFGGNGTPIGSTANVIAISISEKTRTPITTATWMRVGLPAMIITCSVGTIMFVLMFSTM